MIYQIPSPNFGITECFINNLKTLEHCVPSIPPESFLLYKVLTVLLTGAIPGIPSRFTFALDISGQVQYRVGTHYCTRRILIPKDSHRGTVR
jgi:hypothetical protein